jgi:prolyl oligopeptidase
VSTGTDGFEMYFHDLRSGGMPTLPPMDGLPAGLRAQDQHRRLRAATGKFLVMTEVDAPQLPPGGGGSSETRPRRIGRTSSPSEELLEGVSTGGGLLFAELPEGCHHALLPLTSWMAPDEQAIQLPDLGSAGGFGGKRDATFGFYSFTSFTDPGTIFKYDYATGKSEVFSRPELKFDPSQFVTEQVFYPSKDGTKVPMFIVHKKGPGEERQEPDPALCLRGFQCEPEPQLQHQPHAAAWNKVACSHWPTCAVAANTARTGTRPA